MPVRIRLSRGGAKKRPFYRIVVADSRRARDGKFIDQVGTYNPMLSKDNPERIKLDIDKAKNWIQKGAQPSDRVTLFFSNLGVVDKTCYN
jgi:ribosomal protein S16